MADHVRQLAHRLRHVAREEARRASPPVERFKVTSANPLTVEAISSDLVLEEDDPDVEIERKLLADRPDVGDTVRVHQSGDGDYLITGVVD